MSGSPRRRSDHPAEHVTPGPDRRTVHTVDLRERFVGTTKSFGRATREAGCRRTSLSTQPSAVAAWLCRVHRVVLRDDRSAGTHGACGR